MLLSEAETTLHVVWLIRVRFLVLVSICIITLAAQFLGIQFIFLPLYSLMLFSLTYNIIFYFLNLQKLNEITVNLLNYFRIALDLLVTTLMIHFSGGVDSSFYMLYFTDLATTALFFGSSMGIFMSGHAIIFYSTNNLLEALKVIPHYQIAILPTIIYTDPGYFLLKSFSLFFIAIALIYAMSYLSIKLHEKQLEIEKLSSDKINFMNMVAHELRSPLTSIQEYVSLILEGLTGQDPETQQKALTIIQKQAKRITDMVNDLLNLAHIEHQTIRFKIQNLSINSLIDSALTEMQPQIDANQIKILKELPDKLPKIYGNENNLIEVIINLLSNAIKFSNKGDSIIITAKKAKDQIQVSVKDKGMGISHQDISHIFQKFYRSSLQEKYKQKGTGLGLALSKAIIERHGGHIWVESEGPNKGSTFYFTLPTK